MKSDNFTDEEKEAFEQELEESDSTAILLGIYGELQAIRSLLEQPQDASEENLTCSTCGESYTSEKQLRQHARTTHKAPSDMPLEDIAEL
jgi:protein-arginine kinase activator protein McsA